MDDSRGGKVVPSSEILDGDLAILNERLDGQDWNLIARDRNLVVRDWNLAALNRELGILDRGLVVHWDVCRLRDDFVFDVFPDLLRAFLIGSAGFFLRFAKAAKNLIGRHSNGDFVAGNKGIDLLPPFITFAEIFHELLRERIKKLRGRPSDNPALQGIAAYSEEPVRSDRLELDGLGKPESSCGALAVEVQIAGRWFDQLQIDGLKLEI